MDNKIKLLHVSESLIGGVSSYINELLEFQSVNDQIDLVGVFGPSAELNTITTRNVSCYGYIKKGRGFYSSLNFLFKLHRLLSKERPNIVHLHSTIAGFLGRLLIVIFFYNKIKVVYCAHCWKFDNKSHFLNRYAYALIEKFLLPFADAVINISPHEQDLLKHYGFNTANVHLVVNGISRNVNIEARSSNIKSGLRLLFVGRFDYQKGLDLLLDEMNNFKAKEVSLTIVGKGVVNSISTTIPDGVEIVEWVNRESLQQWLADFDCVIMPSRWEGMPMLALEVLRAGGVIAASNIPPVSYIVESGVNGFVFDIEKSGFLVDVIDFLSTADLNNVRLNAKNTFVSKFTSERVNDQLFAIYKNLLRA
ncbi:glycosyltransferase [Azonexus fungiphilus]|uniref:glycosyltransferase n=1 Tax=Azonexus fungiphilus TaxID=146940 RepID=UPI00156B2F6A|nr:glycosyltransferase [Azonexus fungiphilus]NHC07549.1 glycosyltransferase family 4 protein [Azonexus fungiphilus]